MSNPGERPPPSINDTAEVPVVVQETPPPQQPVPPPKTKRNGCLIGCLIFVVLGIVLLIVGGLFLKNVWDDFWDGDSGSTTTTIAAGPVRDVGVEEYQRIVTVHLTTLGSGVEVVGTKCQNLNDVTTCRTAVRSLRDELVATQTELNGVKAPAAFTNSDAEFRAALTQAIKGTDDVDAGLGGNPLRLGRGLLEVSKAGSTLSSAGAQLTEDASAAATTPE